MLAAVLEPSKPEYHYRGDRRRRGAKGRRRGEVKGGNASPARGQLTAISGD